MDPKSFYGPSTKFISKTPNDGNASDDPDMSDDETASTSRNTVYASDSENEHENSAEDHVGMIIPELESEEEEDLDDVPLQQQLDRITLVRPRPIQTK
jgi:hypothetical protein